MTIIKETHFADFMPENIGTKCAECKEYINMQQTRYQVFIINGIENRKIDFCSIKHLKKWFRGLRS